MLRESVITECLQSHCLATARTDPVNKSPSHYTFKQTEPDAESAIIVHRDELKLTNSPVQSLPFGSARAPKIERCASKAAEMSPDDGVAESDSCRAVSALSLLTRQVSR